MDWAPGSRVALACPNVRCADGSRCVVTGKLAAIPPSDNAAIYKLINALDDTNSAARTRTTAARRNTVRLFD